MKLQVASSTNVMPDPPQEQGAEGKGASSIAAEAFLKLAKRLRQPKAPPPEPAPREAMTLEPGQPVQPAKPARQAKKPRLLIAQEAPPGAAESATRILDLMATGQGLQPQERALAADALLLHLPRLATPHLVKIAERVAMMDHPPPLVTAKLIRDERGEVVAPLLERGANVSDADLIDAASVDDMERLRMIARRRSHSPALSAHLSASGDPVILLALLRNPGSQIAYNEFAVIAELAIEHPALLAPLVTKPELPAAVAFELYWVLPPELRRLMLTRFLTDSGTLGRILRMTLAQDDGLHSGALREERAVLPEDLDEALEALASGLVGEASQRMSDLTGLRLETVRRILGDPHGEALIVLLKVMEVSRSRFIAALERLRGAKVIPDSAGDDHLLSVFDGMSFAKARMLAVYWDWSIRKIGPYAGRATSFVGPGARTLVEPDLLA